MKRVLFLLAAILVLAFPTACGEKKEPGVTAKDVKKEAKEAVGTAVAYTQQQKEEYQKMLEGKIKEYDRKLEELKGKAEKMEKGAKAEANQQIEELQKKQQAAVKKMEGLKSASGQAWEDIKKGVDTAFEDMEKSLDRVVSRFK